MDKVVPNLHETDCVKARDERLKACHVDSPYFVLTKAPSAKVVRLIRPMQLGFNLLQLPAGDDDHCVAQQPQRDVFWPAALQFGYVLFCRHNIPPIKLSQRSHSVWLYGSPRSASRMSATSAGLW